MDDNVTPKIGQILYEEKLDDKGNIKTASLLYIDEEPKPDGGWMVTWIAQMEDYGNGELEVYTDGTAGGTASEHVKRIATDADIMKFVNAIKKSTNFKEQIDIWLENIEKSEDYSILLLAEKERLKKLINS